MASDTSMWGIACMPPKSFVAMLFVPGACVGLSISEGAPNHDQILVLPLQLWFSVAVALVQDMHAKHNRARIGHNPFAGSDSH
jgi:hypothetical protein